MDERFITCDTYEPGTLAANHSIIDEFPFGVTFHSIKAWASNDSDATLSGSDGTTTFITATTIGDSGDPSSITADSADAPFHIAANTAITYTIDYDGATGTAADDLRVIRIYRTD